MYPPNKPYHHTIPTYDITYRATPHHTPYRTTYHTIPILYLHTRGAQPYEDTRRACPISRIMQLNRGTQSYEHSSAAMQQEQPQLCHSSAAGAHICSTAIQSKFPTQPSITRFSVYSMNSQQSPCVSSNAGGVENSSQAAQAEQESSHATSVSGLWDRRVHRVGRHRVNACYPLVGLELGGALELRPNKWEKLG